MPRRPLALAGLLLGAGPLVAARPALAQDCVLPPQPSPVLAPGPAGAVRLAPRGDARALWYEDEDGYPVLWLREGLRYAELEPVSGELRPTPFVPGVDDPRELGLLRVAPGDVRAAVGSPRPAPVTGRKGAGATPAGPAAPTPGQAPFHGHVHAGGGVPTSAPVTGTLGNLVLLLRFADHGPGGQDRTLPSDADVDVIMNAVGGDPTLAPTGSVRDHYLENSYDQLDLQSTVVGWLDVPQTEIYYANGNSGLTSVTWELIVDGLELADATVDFSQFDADGDGWVDAITFLHSGYGAEWGGTDQYGTHYTDRMWSHKWSIPTWTSDEGVRVSDYNISPGLWGTSGSDPGRIGVVCHELGHFIGLPDLYDTDGGGQGMGNWCLMAAGSWGFDGSQQYPSHMSSWAKMKLGWLVPQLVLPGLHQLGRLAENPDAFLIQSGFPPGEYLLLENRDAAGFDSVIPADGLVVWHVDEGQGSLGFNDVNTEQGYPGQPGWPTNDEHYRIAMLAADGDYDLERNVNRGDSGDPWRAGFASTLDNGTVPSTEAYQEGTIVANGNRITAIGSPGATLGFTYENPLAPVVTPPAPPAAAPGQPYAYPLAATGGSGPLAWSVHRDAPSYAVTDLGASSYAGTGSAQGWNADDAVWSLALPFEFPFWETVYDRVWVSSNGFLDFGPGQPDPANDDDHLELSLRIAPLWDDLVTDAGGSHDVYVDTSVPGQVSIRWRGETWSSGSQVRFRAVLFDDGRIRFDYGTGNLAVSPSVGISRGYGGLCELPAGYTGAPSLESADSLLFTLSDAGLPPGLSLSPSGLISGTPTAAGSYTFTARVTDADERFDLVPVTIDVGIVDCNGNGVDDGDDIAGGTSQDCNGNGTPDECESVADCNGSGVPDECELAGNDCNVNGIPDECDVDCNGNGTPDACESFMDCNGSGVPDECELAGNDCNVNGIPDECDVDCNGNGTPDACESFADCNANSVPDECDLAGNDCDGNGVPDECDVDCNGNGTPDACESFADCNGSGVPDECELAGNDCNVNGIPDECDVDCNGNGTPDACESFMDCNGSGVPDECELAGNDCNVNGIPDECDVDCNGNGTPDACESFADCNGNAVPDECELAGNDCNVNGIPDECDVDCNGNGTPDACEGFMDCNGSGVPDECELAGNDCNVNGIPDECDVDCNGNGTPDDCESFMDCNANGVPDECELAGNDCNVNGIPDECDVDCNGNGTPDACESFADCNANSVPDECDLAGNDCDGNGVPDECDVDCNGNGTPDACESFADCNGSGVPDECELAGNDCNVNGIPDECDVDCNGNGTPDACESFMDCNGSGVPDECELAGNDCNVNGIPDECDVDCNGNGTPDDCESFMDCNANGVPDECELAGNDCNVNGIPDECDVDCNANGTPDACEGFMDCNGSGVPDECELAGNDCNVNGIPDECDVDCNGNGTPDDCESFTDCNGNGIPDECDPDGDGNGVPDACDGGVGTVACLGVACPCANDDPSAGCANSTGSGGLLTASGSASVAADDLVLDASSLPPANQGLFYMGDALGSSPFFDGIQCAVGNSFRYLDSIQNTGASGTMSYASVVAGSGGLIVPGSTWHFHAWHRDFPGSPCGTGANLTSVLSVTFLP